MTPPGRTPPTFRHGDRSCSAASQRFTTNKAAASHDREAAAHSSDAEDWDPDSEEIEAPAVEARVPDRSLVVTPVVDGAVVPVPAGRRKRAIPVEPRRRSPAPRCGPTAPRGVAPAAERIRGSWSPVAAIRPAGIAGSTAFAGSARSTRSTEVTRPARSARPTGATRSTEVTRSARPTRSTVTAGAVPGSTEVARPARSPWPSGALRTTATTRSARSGSSCADGRLAPATAARRRERDPRAAGDRSQPHSACEGNPGDGFLKIHGYCSLVRSGCSESPRPVPTT
jgi:hypothetical protein